jgi:hypothetical protein
MSRDGTNQENDRAKSFIEAGLQPHFFNENKGHTLRERGRGIKTFYNLKDEKRWKKRTISFCTFAPVSRPVYLPIGILFTC